MIFSQDPLTGADIDHPLSPIDWNAKLSVANGSPLSAPLPRDRAFWIVTDDFEAMEVRYSPEIRFWLRQDRWCRIDGEAGDWGQDEIVGWTDSADDAEEAARLLSEVTA